jgi:nucleoside-diphosphate-sugar epimerase
MVKVLITGGAGYLGSTLSSYLLNKKYSVTVLDNLMYHQTPLLHLCSDKRFNFIKGDVTNFEFLKDLINDFDVVVPLAAIVGAPACDANNSLATKVNFEQIKIIVDNLKNNQKLIMPNTNSQYGSSKDIITEDSPFNPLSHYAKTKCDAENYIMNSGKGICLRLATVFGASPRMRTDLLVNDFVHKAIVDGYIVLFESHFKRNYIHVRDIAHTFDFCIQNWEKMKGDVYNVGLSNANLSKLELAQKIKNHIPDFVIKEDDYKTDSDNRDYIVSNDKLEALGWRPKYSIDDGIGELVQAFKMIIKLNNRNFTNL